MNEGEEPLTATAARMAVAELIDDIDRDAPNIRRLLNGRSGLTLQDSVETILGQLNAAGLAHQVEGTRRYLITASGRAWLRHAEEWEFHVTEIVAVFSADAP